MFNEDEDWDDAADVLSQSVVKKKPNSNSTVVKSKHVGKKSLMRTLQMLGSIPDWKGEDQRQPDSDSDTEAAAPHKRKKKKRKKMRKRTKTTSTTTGEHENNTEVKEEKTVTKKKNVEKTIGVPKSKNAPASETEGKAIPQKPAADATRLRRQQWKSKMKNKRKCKNKYRQNKPQEEVEKDDKPLPTTHSHINGSKQVQAPNNKMLPQKRKKTDEDDDTETSAIKTAKKEREKNFNGSTRDSKTPGQKSELRKAERLKRQRLRNLLRPASPEEPEEEAPKEEAPEEPAPKEPVSEDRSSSLRWRMEQRLEAARFRYINQFLYSSSSGEAKRMFQQDPQAFGIYHKGFTAQVRCWPANPVDAIIAYIHKKPPSLVVADFGCGDCKIALSVKNKVHSFDLVATCDLVTVCDMARVPLKDTSVDIAVFCLSLMGTNLAAFLVEANRVLKRGGVLKIAEVASRFDNVRNFLTALAKLGFKMVSKDMENTHFYAFDFIKTGDAPEKVKNFGLQLKACLYKKR